MGKNKYILDKNQKYYKKCNNGTEVCKLVEELEGASNRNISLGLQLVYSVIAFVMLGDNKIEGRDFFISLFLFSSPFLLEYIFYKSKNKFNNYIFLLQKIIFAITAVIGFVGITTDALTIKIYLNQSYIKVSETFFIFSNSEFSIKWLLVPLGISIGLILTQLFSLESKLEESAAIQEEAA